MKIDEAFYGVQGEGERAGRLTFFIRFWGCGQGCSFCDTPQPEKFREVYSLDVMEQGLTAFTHCTREDDLFRLAKHRSKELDVCITGGEPMLQATGVAAILRSGDLPYICGETGMVLINTSLPHTYTIEWREAEDALRASKVPVLICYSPKEHLMEGAEPIGESRHRIDSWYDILADNLQHRLELKLLVRDHSHLDQLLNQMSFSMKPRIICEFPDRVSLVIQPITPKDFKPGDVGWLFTEPPAYAHEKAEIIGFRNIRFLPQVHTMTCGRNPGRGV